MIVLATIVQPRRSPGSSVGLRAGTRRRDSSFRAAALSRRVLGPHLRVQLLEQRELLGPRTPARQQPEREGDPIARARAAFGHHPLGDRARGFEILRIVEQHQRLQRRVRALAGDGAEQPFGRVEVDRRRRRRRPLPDGVEAAAIEIVALAFDVVRRVPRRERFPQAGRLIRIDARSADRRGPSGRSPRARRRGSARRPADTTVRARAIRSPDPARASSHRSPTTADTWPTSRSASAAPSDSTPTRRTSSPASPAARVRRQASLVAEIRGRGDEPAAEEQRPVAVDHHARGERMARARAASARDRAGSAAGPSASRRSPAACPA